MEHRIQDGKDCDAVTWTDSAGLKRTVYILSGTPGGYIIRYDYVVGGKAVSCSHGEMARLINHYGDKAVGNQWDDDYDGKLSSALVLAGTNHAQWRATFRMVLGPAMPGMSWRNTVQYDFYAGRDDFIMNLVFDSSAAGPMVPHDSRGPYTTLDWQGDDAKGADVSGFAFGTRFRFTTLAPYRKDKTGWDYRAPNTIPFVWAWMDAKDQVADREFGVVATRTYAEQDMGGGYYNDPVATGFPSLPPCARPEGPMPTNWALASQMNAYQGFGANRVTWGMPFGCFRPSYDDALYTAKYSGYPVASWNFSILVDGFSQHGVEALIHDTENIHRTTMTATTGTVIASGPLGAGDFLSPAVGAMPTHAYDPVGFDFVARAWRVQCSAEGRAEVVIDAGGPLIRPTFLFSKAPPPGMTHIMLAGKALVAGTDYLADYQPAAGGWWMTLLADLPAGKSRLSVAP